MSYQNTLLAPRRWVLFVSRSGRKVLLPPDTACWLRKASTVEQDEYLDYWNSYEDA
jgi:hypothetical protein